MASFNNRNEHSGAQAAAYFAMRAFLVQRVDPFHVIVLHLGA